MNDKFRIEAEEVEVCVDCWGREKISKIKTDVLIKIGKYDKNVNVLFRGD